MLVGLSIATVLGLRLSAAPRRAVRAGWIVLAALGSQGVIGYIQYFTHLPAGLVWVHVTGSVLVWIVVLRLVLAVHQQNAVQGYHLSGTVQVSGLTDDGGFSRSIEFLTCGKSRSGRRATPACSVCRSSIVLWMSSLDFVESTVNSIDAANEHSRARDRQLELLVSAHVLHVHHEP
jgi:hypothetical protein